MSDKDLINSNSNKKTLPKNNNKFKKSRGKFF